MAYIVTSALVITKKQDGSDLYLYADAQLPDYVSADEIKRLTALEMISKVADDAATKKPTAQSN